MWNPPKFLFYEKYVFKNSFFAKLVYLISQVFSFGLLVNFWPAVQLNCWPPRDDLFLLLKSLLAFRKGHPSCLTHEVFILIKSIFGSFANNNKINITIAVRTTYTSFVSCSQKCRHYKKAIVYLALAKWHNN